MKTEEQCGADEKQSSGTVQTLGAMLGALGSALLAFVSSDRAKAPSTPGESFLGWLLLLGLFFLACRLFPIPGAVRAYVGLGLCFASLVSLLALLFSRAKPNDWRPRRKRR